MSMSNTEKTVKEIRRKTRRWRVCSASVSIVASQLQSPMPELQQRGLATCMSVARTSARNLASC